MDGRKLEQKLIRGGTIRPGEAVVWLRMGDADRERYGGPEWVAFDAGALYNAPASRLEVYEAETRIPIFLVLHELPTFGTRATRAALFIARREAGVKDANGNDETWAGFDPQTLQVQRRDGAPPPAATDNGHKAPAGGKSRRGQSATSPPGSPAEPWPPSSTT